MTNQITKAVSPFIESQLPEFIRESNPNFVAFLKAYYEWLEQQPSSNVAVVTQSKSLLSYNDVDTTTDEFIQYFINEFLPYFPNDVALDERKLIKAARNFYQKKGSIESIQFLFRVLYGKEADIYFPKDNILKASDGKWVLPQALRLLLTSDYANFDVQKLVQRVGVGANSNAQCVIESATEVVDANLGFEIVELYISSISKPFDDLEKLNVVYGQDANGNPLIFSEKIIAAISNIVIDPNNRGTKYNKGDPVVITGGLEPNDPQAQKAVAYVGNVTIGSITSVNVIFGGYDYRENPNTIVNIVNGPGDNTGTGANVIVTSLDTTNLSYLLVNIDSIGYKANATLNSANFAFANIASANLSTPIARALTYANLQFAPIKTMNVINGGGGYQKVPHVETEVVYYTDLTNDLETISDFTDANASLQFIDDLGYFAAVQVLNGGYGYSNVTDRIVCDSAIGYGATFNFTTNANGGITSVTVTNKGEGYFQIPTLLLSNTNNLTLPAAGHGAVLVGYGYGQGANIAFGVNKIGQIIDFNLVNRGFDYISTPAISLRIQDLIINPINVTQAIMPDSKIYQGASANNGNFLAYVDSYNYTDNVLRIYNYKGYINPYQNLVATLINNQSINLTINTAVTGNVTVYGDGAARANAIFLNGLIQYPGFYFNTDGMLSSDQYLQDANTYHNYSYQIIVEKALITYKNTLMQLAHPAGTSMLGIYVIPANASENTTLSISTSFVSPLTGSVNANAFSPNGVVVGTGTTWAANGIQTNDIIVFNTSDSSRRLQAKRITGVTNTSLNVESNTQFAYDYLVRVSNGSNTIFTSGTDFIGNVAIRDIVLVNASGNLIYSNVTAVTPSTLTVNTVFGTNSSNMVMLVLPYLVNCSYQIVSANRAT